MAWLRIDDRLFLHPKWVGLPATARGLWITALSYCGCQMNNGHVPEPLVAMLGGTPADAEALVAVGLWEIAEHGYQIHDFSEYNLTREEQEEQQERLHEVRAEAGRRGGIRSGEVRRSNRNCPAALEATAKQPRSNLKQNEPPGPVPEPRYITTPLDDRRPISTPRVHTQHSVRTSQARSVGAGAPVGRSGEAKKTASTGEREPEPGSEAILRQADADPARRHWRRALERQEAQATPRRPESWRLQVLRNWLAGDGAPPPPGPAWPPGARSHPPPGRHRLTVVEERIAAGEAVIDQAINAMREQIHSPSVPTFPLQEVAHG